MERVDVRTIRLTWEPELRLAKLSFAEKTQATGEDAAALVRAMRVWVGAKPVPFGLLDDGGNLVGSDREYRSEWGAFFKAHRGHSFLAFFNMSPRMRIAAALFQVAIGVSANSFVYEEEALAWLSTKGIGIPPKTAPSPRA